MIKVLYKASNRYTCQGVTLTPGNNLVDPSKFDDFRKHPGVIARIDLGFIEIPQEPKNAKKLAVTDSVIEEKKEPEEEEIVVENRPVKEVVKKIKSVNSVKALQKVIDSGTTKVRVLKAAAERIEFLVKNK